MVFMKKINLNIFKVITVLIFAVFILFSCEDEFEYGIAKNAVKTSDLSNVSQNTANVVGNVILDGGYTIIAKGVCWATSRNPTISNFRIVDISTNLGSSTYQLFALQPSTTYYVRAYSTNTVGTAYGNELSFTTLAAISPLITTTAITSITPSTALSGGNVTNSGGVTVTARGVCWSNTTSSPTISNSKTIDGSGTGSFTSSLTGLSPNTNYYVRSYATNSVGTSYGATLVFTTSVAVIPSITTSSISSITQTTATGGGNISSDGGSAVISRGVCWSNTTSSPTISNSRTIDGSGIGSFTSSLTGLSPNTTYYVRSYATNGVGTSYGTVWQFTTSAATLASITTSSISSITQTTATGGGNISSDGGSAVISRGVCWSNTTSSPTISNSRTIDGSGIGSFTSSLTGLSPNTTYYVRSYATNGVGTSYGTVWQFTTSAATLASITTSSISSITQTTALSGGNITSDGGATITSKGICWSNTTSTPTTSNSNTTAGSGTGSFSAPMTTLQPNTTYYVRSYAINSAGTAYGNTVSFTTANVILPSLTTNSISSITSSSATSGGNITSDGGSAVTSRGICWSNTTSIPTISNSRTIDGAGTGSFASSITGLLASTTYYVRSYATNGVGTSYGSTISFTTLAQALAVGQSYQGGIIAYIFQSGDSGFVSGETHGLIVTTSNQSTAAQWGCSGTSISTSLNIGTGQSNTTAIVNSCTTSSIAASICNNLVFGGYTDWYLPSYDELEKLYVNRALIGGFNNANYWSSSQGSSTLAYTINLFTGTGISSVKSSGMYVRAIRKF